MLPGCFQFAHHAYSVCLCVCVCVAAAYVIKHAVATKHTEVYAICTAQSAHCTCTHPIYLFASALQNLNPQMEGFSFCDRYLCSRMCKYYLCQLFAAANAHMLRSIFYFYFVDVVACCTRPTGATTKPCIPLAVYCFIFHFAFTWSFSMTAVAFSKFAVHRLQCMQSHRMCDHTARHTLWQWQTLDAFIS